MYRRFSIATKKGLTGLMSASILFFSCCSTNHSGNNHSSNKDIETKKNKVKNNLFEVISPAQQETVYFGESLAVRLKGKKNIPPDSIIAKIGSDIIDIQKDNDFQYQLLLNPKTAGRKNIALTIFSRDTLSEKHHIKIVALPKTSPKTVQYEIVIPVYKLQDRDKKSVLLHIELFLGMFWEGPLF